MLIDVQAWDMADNIGTCICGHPRCIELMGASTRVAACEECGLEEFWVHPAPDYLPCECGHPRDKHEGPNHDDACSQCGWHQCQKYRPTDLPTSDDDICRCGHPRDHHVDYEYDCQDCGFTGCLEFHPEENP